MPSPSRPQVSRDTTDQLRRVEGRAYGSVIWRLTLTVTPFLTVTVALSTHLRSFGVRASLLNFPLLQLNSRSNEGAGAQGED
jgi:hypothetical protein